MQQDRRRSAAAGCRVAAMLLAAAMAMTAGALGADRLEGPTWLAEDVRGGGVIDNAQSVVSFAAGGKVTGSGGCNRLFANATIAGDAVTFGGIGTTRTACAPALMDQEQKFLAALTATRTFRVEGLYLRFYDAAGVEVIRFTELK